MKVISLKFFLIIIIVTAWTGLAAAGMDLLTDKQMAIVTGGSEEQVAVGGSQKAEDPTSVIVNEDVAVLEQVNLSETIIDNSVVNDQSSSTMVLADDAQRDAVAVNISNTLGGKVANGLNAMFLHDTTLHLDSPFTSLNQSNIIIQK